MALDLNELRSDGSIIKTIPIIRDFSLNPHCSHGPAILFERDGSRYFACSAYRSRKLCQFYLPEDKWTVKDEISTVAPKGTESSSKLKRKDDKNQITNPLSQPKQKNKGEAQFHFNEKTVKFFMDQLANFDSVLCVGTPSLFEEIKKNFKGKLKSFLLDIDSRFENFYTENFSLYNMCNHYFFGDNSNYMEFLSDSKKLAIVLDPPFGVKAELIWHGCVSGVKKDFSNIHGMCSPDRNISFEILWIFPYFMEGHIIKSANDEVKMSDFHVEYTNHPKYHGSKSKSSPIRIFTSMDLSKFPLPEDDYRYCDMCIKWVDKFNMHCDICETCTTKDGGRTYVHCYKCQKCVKPSWKHCKKCALCHLDDVNSCRNKHNIIVNVNQSKKQSKFNKSSDEKTSQIKQSNLKRKHFKHAVGTKKNMNVGSNVKRRKFK